jgi:chemotaxis protein methyltransferase WspC
MAFAFRKTAAVPAAQRLTAAVFARPIAASPLLTPSGPVNHRPRAASTPAPPVAGLGRLQVPRPVADLSEATRLADQGHFAEAAICCDEHLHRFGPSATAFYLIGLVRDATGNHTEAAACYRKALYLDPNHYETLIHLALLLEQRGDPAGADILRTRTRRLEQKRRASHE